MTGLARAVRTVVRTCLAVAPGENVLVVVDEPLQDVGEALRREAQDAQADAVLAVMSARENHGVEPPPPIAAALRRLRRLHRARRRARSRTRRRARRATDNGARGATMPTVTADMLARLMDVDFDLLRRAQPGGGRPAQRRRRGARHLPARDRPAPRPQPAARASPTTATSPRPARSATSRAARASSRRPGERGRSPRARWPRSASSRATRRT